MSLRAVQQVLADKECKVNDLHWNHRVIQDISDPENITWGVYEVHYRGNRPVGFGDPVKLVAYPDEDGGPVGSLHWTIDHAGSALEKPNLIWDGVKLHGK